MIAVQGPLLVFVEVKTRATAAHGSPEEAVDSAKQRRLARGAADYVRRVGHPREMVRFDVISVVFEPRERAEHHTDVFAPAWVSR